MLQPVNLQLAHFNVEHSAQISKDAMAAAQQTGQAQETVKENVMRAQRVEASIASAEAQKIKSREENEKNRRGGQQQMSSDRYKDKDNAEADSDLNDNAKAAGRADRPVKSFEFYA
ncbi:hypothetical protein FACS1894187_00390 [Synergistales bacterium]|nr:hypothetical protein FACS1894187_00390 [Synergistales bacterium]